MNAPCSRSVRDVYWIAGVVAVFAELVGGQTIFMAFSLQRWEFYAVQTM